MREVARGALLDCTCVKKVRTLKSVADATGIPYPSLVKFRREKVLDADRVLLLLRWLSKEKIIELPREDDWQDGPIPEEQPTTIDDLAAMLETCLNLVRSNALERDSLVRLLRQNLKVILESLSHI